MRAFWGREWQLKWEHGTGYNQKQNCFQRGILSTMYFVKSFSVGTLLSKLSLSDPSSKVQILGQEFLKKLQEQ